MISKELLSEVSGQECLYVKVDELTGKTVYQYMTPVDRIPWNIYELANKCKEWAFNIDTTMIKSSVTEALMGIASIRDDNGTILFCEVCDTEPEAIFKACQWILDNKDQK